MFESTEYFYVWNLSMILKYLIRIYKSGNTIFVKIIRHQTTCKTSEASTEVHMALKKDRVIQRRLALQ